MKKIIIFGSGSVSRVITQCLFELFKNSGEKISFIFVCRDKDKAKNSLYKIKDVLKNSEFIELKDFSNASQIINTHDKYLAGSIAAINVSLPYFNDSILKFASSLGINYCDMSSDIYNEETRKNFTFNQDKYDTNFKEKNIFALINAGISPGITNFLIGEKILESEKDSKNKITSIKLHLLENIVSSEVVFSWSPKEAFIELEEKPRWFENNKSISITPFTNGVFYEFPHFMGKVEQYPISQEEIFSLHKTYPHIPNIRAYAGGSETELVKNLFQLNLLSKNEPVCRESGMSIEAVVTAALPGLKTPEEMIEITKRGVIKSAQFAAVAEITKEDVIEVTGLTFKHFMDLLDSPYEGSTYISYSAGIGAAILFFYTYKFSKKNISSITGVIRSEELPAKFGSEISLEMKYELVKRGIDFISHSHPAKFCKGACNF